MARTISFKEAINVALDQEMTRDPSVIVMGRIASVAPEVPAKTMLGGDLWVSLKGSTENMETR